MNRRDFIITSSTAATVLGLGWERLFAGEKSTINKIADAAVSGKWNELPVGEVTGKTAQMLTGKPYVGGVLDQTENEICTINLDNLDCVTLFEQSLCIARLIKKNMLSLDNLVKEVTFTRYRSGLITDYTSRLHYTADWIFDNARKGTIKDISQELDGKNIKFNLNFMSHNPKYYKQLTSNPDLVKKIASIEKEINSRDYHLIHNKDIQSIEDKLKTGDIIAVATNKPGLDYSHTGLIIRKNDVPHFYHASSKMKKVILDNRISSYVQQVKSNIGISVLRPLEPMND